MLEELSKGLSSIKKIQSEMKDTVIKIKDNLQGNNSRVDEAENQINDLEQQEEENNQWEQAEKGIQKNEDSISRLWNNFKHSNILITGVSEGEEKEQEIGHLFEKIMKENFLNLVKEIDIHVQEAQRVPDWGEKRKKTPLIWWRK